MLETCQRALRAADAAIVEGCGQPAQIADADYYDERMEFGSEDPSDANNPTRGLALMPAEDY